MTTTRAPIHDDGADTGRVARIPAHRRERLHVGTNVMQRGRRATFDVVDANPAAPAAFASGGVVEPARSAASIRPPGSRSVSLSPAT
ncbi:MAG TPA: hypothetical protein VK771_11465, partial [Acidimicrobiia bacterium]|nr:hypothetical protein [Acidimicrobiia bacterium]